MVLLLGVQGRGHLSSRDTPARSVTLPTGREPQALRWARMSVEPHSCLRRLPLGGCAPGITLDLETLLLPPVSSPPSGGQGKDAPGSDRSAEP